MQLVTDRAADLSPSQLNALPIDLHYLPLTIELDGKTYISGIDIQPDGFYELLENSDGMPTTSLPAPGEIAEIYRQVAKDTNDNEILSIHLSQNLSGTFNAARVAAETVKAEGINVHMVDTRTLSGAEGWQVEAAAYAIAAGWDVQKIDAHLAQISNATRTVYTLPTLKYLIHGGRISHLSGLLANTLGIKPQIGVSYETGKYESLGRVRTFKKAVIGLADVISKRHPFGSKIRVQPLHALNPDALELMKSSISEKFDVEFVEDGPIAPVLGAHTGSGLVGCAYAAVDKLPERPS